MESIKALRGFRDVYGEEVEKFSLIESVSRHYLGLLGYREIQIPALEKTELFKRSIGDTTDIVEKEMFTFTDRSGDSVTLRPEGTAGVVRAYLQASFYARERVSRLFTMGPMFRHERPQKGRFRQFSQMDVEVFGVAEPIVDAEPEVDVEHDTGGALDHRDEVIDATDRQSPSAPQLLGSAGWLVGGELARFRERLRRVQLHACVEQPLRDQHRGVQPGLDRADALDGPDRSFSEQWCRGRHAGLDQEAARQLERFGQRPKFLLPGRQLTGLDAAESRLWDAGACG